jgi:ribosomal protein L6P/L9E
MKDLTSVETLAIPAGVSVAVKARKITVEGPRGTLVKNVRHIAMDIQVVSGFWSRKAEGDGSQEGQRAEGAARGSARARSDSQRETGEAGSDGGKLGRMEMDRDAV